MKKALGLIETYGYVTAIEAADASLKAANVSLKKCEFVKGGLVAILITGDVSAVKASVYAGKTAANRIGQVISTTVIARTGEGLDRVLYKDVEKSEENDIEKAISDGPKDKSEGDKVKELVEEGKPAKTIRFEGQIIELNSEKELNKMRVVELRKMVRRLEDFHMNNEQIKYAKKRELIDAIIEYSEKER
ncbi:MAG: BMC domain-containing protein [Thermotaleaceae bacterium]